MGNSKPQTNTPDNNSNHKFKDIEEAIQKAIDNEASKVNLKKNLYKKPNINNKN